jgi:hypothetical protein
MLKKHKIDISKKIVNANFQKQYPLRVLNFREVLLTKGNQSKYCFLITN